VIYVSLNELTVKGVEENITFLLHGAVILEKLTSLQLVKKFPVFYGT
jgi:hypothetical protein